MSNGSFDYLKFVLQNSQTYINWYEVFPHLNGMAAVMNLVHIFLNLQCLIHRNMHLEHLES